MSRVMNTVYFGLIFFGLQANVFSAGKLLDVLERPSAATSLAAQSVLLTVTKAGDRLVAAGERGIILLSDDQGIHWRQVATPVSTTLTASFFSDRLNGWVVGHSGVVLHTNDGGETWIKQLDGNRIAAATLEEAISAETDSPTGNSLLRFAELMVSDGPDKPLLDVFFFDSQHGIIVGAYGLILSTEDAGRTWKSIRAAVNDVMNRHLYQVRKVKDQLWLIGEQGALYRRQRGTDTFDEISIPYEGTLFGLAADRHGTLVAYGLRGVIYSSRDNGATWNIIENQFSATLIDDLSGDDDQIILVDQSGNLIDAIHRVSLGPRVTSLKSPSPVTSVTRTSNGSLVFGTLQGMYRQKTN